MHKCTYVRKYARSYTHRTYTHNHIKLRFSFLVLYLCLSLLQSFLLVSHYLSVFFCICIPTNPCLCVLISLCLFVTATLPMSVIVSLCPCVLVTQYLCAFVLLCLCKSVFLCAYVSASLYLSIIVHHECVLTLIIECVINLPHFVQRRQLGSG